MNTVVDKKDASLYIDVTCWQCKREVAMSNTIEREGRRYCNRCAFGSTIEYCPSCGMPYFDCFCHPQWMA